MPGPILYPVFAYVCDVCACAQQCVCVHVCAGRTHMCVCGLNGWDTCMEQNVVHCVFLFIWPKDVNGYDSGTMLKCPTILFQCIGVLMYLVSVLFFP